MDFDREKSFDECGEIDAVRILIIENMDVESMK